MHIVRVLTFISLTLGLMYVSRLSLAEVPPESKSGKTSKRYLGFLIDKCDA